MDKERNRIERIANEVGLKPTCILANSDISNKSDEEIRSDLIKIKKILTEIKK